VRIQKELYCEGYGKGLPEEDRIIRLLQLASTRTAETLLDIGCGDGSITVALKGVLRCREAFGVEISSEGAKQARDKGIDVRVLNVDESPLPFAADSMDAVYAGEILEHVYDPDRLLGEIYRVLRPTGFAIIDVPNLGWWVDRLSLLLGYQPMSTESSLRFGSAGKLFIGSVAGGGGHLRIWTVRAFRQVLRLHTFRVVTVLGAGGGKRFAALLPLPLRLLYPALNGWFTKIPSLAQFTIALADR
jgi:methionine biosynthesis protein MetW